MFDKEKNWIDSQRVKIGDRCHVEGKTGTITEVVHREGNGMNGWTGIRVSFDEHTGLQNTVYNNAVYGSSNWAFTYIS